MSQRFQCICCGFLTLGQKPPGTYEICPVCWWEDDDIQARDAAYAGGANSVSLHQAQENFRRFGASEAVFADKVRRPRPDEVPTGG